MSKITVFPWSKVAQDIATAKGFDEAELEALARSQWQKRQCHGENAVDETGGFIDLDEYGRDPEEVAAESEINGDVYRALKGGDLQAYYPDCRPMQHSDVLTTGIRLQGVCVEPVTVNALLKDKGHVEVWEPKKRSQSQAPGRTWQDNARAIADELDRKDANAGAHDSVCSMADRVAAELRKRGIHGPRGPVSGSTVKREALQGGRWVRPRDNRAGGETGETTQAE